MKVLQHQVEELRGKGADAFQHVVSMRLRDTNQVSEGAFGEFAVAHLVSDIGQQLASRVLEGQVGLSSYFSLKYAPREIRKNGKAKTLRHLSACSSTACINKWQA